MNEIVNGINGLAERLRKTKTKTINELILENTLDGVITVDNNGAITMLNPAAEQMTGYKLEQVLGKPYSTLVDDKNFDSPLLDTLYNGIDHISIEVDFPVAGQIIKISSSTSHFNDYDPLGTTLKEKVKNHEKELIINELKHHNRHRENTAKSLGVSKCTLLYKIQEYEIFETIN